MYKYIIRSDNGKFYFGMYPNNSNIQSIGRSILYESRDDCLRALDEFKEFVLINDIDRYNSEFVNIILDSDKGYLYEYKKNSQVIFYRDKYVEDIEQIYENIKQIYDNIKVEVRSDL